MLSLEKKVIIEYNIVLKNDGTKINEIIKCRKVAKLPEYKKVLLGKNIIYKKKFFDGQSSDFPTFDYLI